MKAVTASLAAALLLATAACGDGPREEAGEQADNQAGAVSSEDTIESGPAETSGERQDDAFESAEDANETQADALEDAAEAQRDAAEQNAAALEEQAERTRNQ